MTGLERRRESHGRARATVAYQRRLTSSGLVGSIALAATLLFSPMNSAATVPVLLTGRLAPARLDLASAAVPSRLSWHSCARTFRCAILSVPVSYQHPQVGEIALAVVMLASPSRHPLGDIVLNPGGPGGSGVQFIEQAAGSFPAGLRSQFNLVSFDPRGVGASDPVQCTSAAGTRQLIRVNPNPTTPQEVAQVVRATKAFVAGCKAHTPRSILDNVATIDTVRDMDRLRAALGEEKLNYFGLSYGTYIGEVYAEHFPRHLRAMVLDGVIDPSLDVVALETQQAQGFQQELSAFFSWCDTNRTCIRELPDGARASYETLFNRLTHGAVLSANLKPAFGGLQPVSLGTAAVGLAGSLYSSDTWPDLAQAIQVGLTGDGALFAALAFSYAGVMANGQFSNQESANVAINCEDLPAPTSVGTYEKLARQMAAVAPDFGGEEAWGSLPCAFWPVASTARPAAVRAPGAPAVLVVGSTGDPATPYAAAKAVAGQFEKAVLLTRTGAGHTAYFSSACVRQFVEGYFTKLTLPAVGTTCPTN